MTTSAQPAKHAQNDRAARRRTLKQRATAASLAALLTVFGAVAVTDLSRERGLAAPVAAPSAPAVSSAVPSFNTTGNTTSGPLTVRQPVRVRTRQS